MSLDYCCLEYLGDVKATLFRVFGVFDALTFGLQSEVGKEYGILRFLASCAKQARGEVPVYWLKLVVQMGVWVAGS